ncbi:fimbrillin family protein [Dysgonomonas macrotermitis]|uniref:Fimbrillin-like n=1 Tax=Dysgonomonas macrotermitis TaxID=1346286 RepID=A0A1M5J801_9BACT|nr:fimbrillin family protein [Dysgonomonas macrotermitis]SHG36688.1 Fimbrillin-like [Dysgonomonas macrotermitis]
MKRFLLSMAVIAVSITGFYSCSNEEEGINRTANGTANLSIETEISATGTALRSTKSSLSAFGEGSQLGLYVTNGTMGSDYPQGPYNNVMATLTSGKWVLNPSVKLGITPATIFAYYPYNPAQGYTSTNFHVYHTNQVDYMYGTNAEGQGSINRDNPNVRLRMNHALSLLQFKISKMNYPGESKLTRIEVSNASGKMDLKSSATLDIATGALTFSDAGYEPAFIENVNGLYNILEPSVAEADINEVIVIPVDNVNANGNILIRFTIDSTVYSYSVPANTSWKQGYKYTYDVLVNGTELVIDDVVITDWQEEANNGGRIDFY